MAWWWEKCFSWIPHKEPILALVFSWYTNTEYNGRKNNINSFVYIRENKHFIPKSDIKKKKYINVSQRQDLYPYGSLNEQYAE